MGDQIQDTKKISLLGLILGVFFFILYFNYFKFDPILKRDDQVLILPLKEIHHFSDYIEAVKNNTILDVQPIRDLSLWIDLKIFETTGFSVFHLTNFFLFLLLIFLFSQIFLVLNFSPQAIIFSVLLFSIHPIMVSSVGWISSRKHVLALVFLLISLLSLLKEKKITWKLVLTYFLSILSHQIFILFPVWVFIYIKIKNLKIDYSKFILLLILGTMILTLGTYKTFYLGMGNTTYTDFDFMENVSRYLLSAARSLVLIVFPISISAAYFQGNPLNLLGIPLLVILLFAIYKDHKKNEATLWIILAILSHILTAITFVHDTYLYLPLICFLIAGNYYLKNNIPHIPKKLEYGLLAMTLIGFSYKTISASQMWTSDLKLWQYSYENEDSPYSAILLGSHLIPKNETLGLQFLEWGAKNYNLEGHKQILQYFLMTIYTSSLPIGKKIEILKNCERAHEIYQGYLGLTLLEGTDAQMENGIQILQKLLKPLEYYAKGSDGERIILSIKYLCQHFPGKDAACKKLNITY